jgi:hypothetical protein
MVTLSKEAVEASLLLDSISQTDKGTYFCQGKNNAGVVTGNVTLIVPGILWRNIYFITLDLKNIR